MNNMEDQPLYVLEEQLARQKSILANKLLVRRLPDKGAKVKESALKLEAEIERRKKERLKKSANISSKEVGKLEWTLAGSRTTEVNYTGSGGSNGVLDSDDEEEDGEGEEHALKIVATSQISQRLPKPTCVNNDSKSKSNNATETLAELCNERLKISGSSESEHLNREKTEAAGQKEKLDKYVARLVHVDSSKPQKSKYVPGKTLKSKEDGSMSPAAESTTSKTSGGSGRSTPSKSGIKWDECLLPPSHTDGVKVLPMHESIKISEEKYKKEEEIAAAAASAPRKKYAYDKLKEQGLLGTYTVEMQVSRPIRTDLDDDDLEEDDLSDDRITEDESEPEDNSEADGQKAKSESRQKTSKDLSNLLNASLKLS